MKRMLFYCQTTLTLYTFGIQRFPSADVHFSIRNMFLQSFLHLQVNDTMKLGMVLLFPMSYMWSNFLLAG